MPRRFVDLSIYLENEVLSDPPAFAPKIEYLTHENTVEQIAGFFPGLKKGDLPDGEGWAVEFVQLCTHNGTHLDAPYHYHSTMNQALGGKERAIAIDEVPLEWCFQPGVKLDFRHFEDGYVVTAADVEAELRRIGHELQPLEIVVVNTRAGQRYGSPDFVSAGCGMGYEATMYLLERGVRLTGTDAWSWDAPFVHTARRYGATGDASLIWEGHKAGRDIGYCHLEKLHNLESLPPSGFYISCFPHKIRGASAGWTRAVAIFDDALMAGTEAAAVLNDTHDPSASSWLASAQAEGCDFPIQNLPLGVFRRRGSDQAFRGGVALGDQVIDLAALAHGQVLTGLAAEAAQAAAQPALNAFLALGPAAWHALRQALFQGLREQAPARLAESLRLCLVPQAEPEMAVPTRVGNYTDFYTSIHHARNVGQLLRPEDPLTPNFQWLPMAYHGRASSVVVSGTPFHRPRGQSMAPGQAVPGFGACRRLDYELELGFFIGPGNALGQPIALDQAESHIFGLCLLNDWSARDHQFWEMAPLGPFLGKNFCTSISPWIVSLEALAPYRTPFERPAGDPQPLAYLDSAAHRASGGLDIQLEVWLQTGRHRERGLAGERLSATRFAHQYWTPAQMVTQHTAGGCNLQPGDLIGTGTVSGPTPGEAGALVELSEGGTRAVNLAATGEERHFLEDGDAVVLRGWCDKPGAARIGFGECRGEVLPALG